MKNKFLIISVVLSILTSCGTNEKPEDVSFNSLPRWRGFNLLEKINENNHGAFLESDFIIMQELGFNFARLPMSYLCWVNEDGSLNEKSLEEIDQAIEWGRKYNVHVSLNIHKAPGYWVNTSDQQPNLFDNDSVLSLFADQWRMFARRYKGIPNKQLSFDLLNEPITTDEKYIKMVSKTVEAIYKEDPGRLVIADGNGCGRKPVPQLREFRVAQSGRGYDPLYVTHFKCPWVGEEYGNATVPPTWPYTEDNGKVYDKEALKEMFAPWISLKDSGIGVHIGEMGVNKHTPHNVTLAYLEDMLSILKDNNIGWAFWNLRGTNGIFDSQREDVEYEKYGDLLLDRKMLELIQKY